MTHPLMSEFNETVWFDKWKYEEAERKHAETLPRTKVIRFSESDSHQVDTTISSKKPWFTTDLRQMARKKQRLYRKARKINSDECWDEFKEFRQVFQSTVKHARLVYKYGPDYQSKRSQGSRNRSKSNSFSDDTSERRRKRTSSNGSKPPRTYISGRKSSQERNDRRGQAPNAQTEILNRMQTLEKETKQLRTITDELHQTIQVMAKEMKVLVLAVTKTMDGANTKEVDTVKNDTADESDDDSNLSDDEDLFGSSDDEDHEEKERIKQERLAAYKAKKEKKPALIAKSNVILDVKPWDDETDMNEVTKLVKEIQMDGLVWGASKLVPLAYGIKKLQISCVVEDDKVSIDELQEKICENEDHVQSVDIAAFNKV